MSKLSKWMLPGLLALFLIFGCKPIKNNYLWQNEIIYFLLIDRFHNGDPTNDRGNNPASHVTYVGTNSEALKTYQGGDLQGVIQRLDYLDSLGITAIWLSPFFDNSDSDFVGWWPYHGYHPVDFYSVDEHFGTIADLKELVNEAHRRGIKILFDMVFNQVAANHPWVTDPGKKDWFHRTSEGTFFPITDWFDQAQIERGALHGMPDLNTENPEVVDYLTQMSQFWIDQTGCDGFRLDAVKHVSPSFWDQFNRTIHQKYGNRFFVIGEIFWGEPERLMPYLDLDFNALFDIPGYYAIKNTFGQGGSIGDLSDFRKQADHDYNSYPMATLIDNHDVVRFNVGIQSHADAKQNLALNYLLTSPGIPVLYYGTEIGLPGGPLENPVTGDPQDYVNRLMFPESLDLRESRILEETSALIRLRKSSPALTKSPLFEIYKDWGVYAFLRGNIDEQLLVVLNNAATSETVSFAMKNDRYAFTGLGDEVWGSGGMIATGDSIWVTLQPFSAAVWSVDVAVVTANPWTDFTERYTGDYQVAIFKYAQSELSPDDLAIAGDFTNWKPKHFPTQVDGDTLKMQVPLRPGSYRYKLVLNNRDWISDPLAQFQEADPYGGQNSVIEIP